VLAGEKQVSLNPKLVLALFAKGERPRYSGLEQNAKDQCGHVYYTLMQACWVMEKSDRPDIKNVAQALALAKIYAENATPEAAKDTILVAAIKDEATQARADKVMAVDQRELQTYDGFLASLGLQDRQEDLAEYLTNPDKLAELKEMDEKELNEDILDDIGFDEQTKEKFQEAVRELKKGTFKRVGGLSPYGDFLASLGLQDRKEDLAAFLSEPGEELTELMQMDEEELNDDILEDSDLAFDPETKEKFRTAVRELNGGIEVELDTQEEKSEFHPATMAAAVKDAREREKRWPKWSLLKSTLEMKQVDANAAATLDPQELVTKLKAENEAQVKAIAEKDEELAQMRKQLAKFEAVPP
jgi:hypothetical protein